MEIGGYICDASARQVENSDELVQTLNRTKLQDETPLFVWFVRLEALASSHSYYILLYNYLFAYVSCFVLYSLCFWRPLLFVCWLVVLYFWSKQQIISPIWLLGGECQGTTCKHTMCRESSFLEA